MDNPSSKLNKESIATSTNNHHVRPVPGHRSAGSGEPAVRAASTSNPALATVLCVEDNPTLRGLMTEVLAGAGYRILQAQDGEAALDAARRSRNGIDLLVTDLVMPNMLGSELVEQLARSGIELPVLFISGYSLEYHSPPIRARNGFLPKPFAPDKLIQAVEELLRTY